MNHQTLQKFDLGNGREGLFHSLPALETAGFGAISRLPVSIRIVLESVRMIAVLADEHDLRTFAGARPQAANAYTRVSWGSVSKWASRSHRLSECCRTNAAIHMSLVGMGVPCLRN